MGSFELIHLLIKNALEQGTEGCVFWERNKDKDGYALASKDGVTYRGNRLACEAKHGPPPFEDAEAGHVCGDARCINPHHLRWVTAKENAADRNIHGTTLFGASNPMAKLGEQDAIKIIELYEAGETQKVLSEQFNVKEASISGIVRGSRWAHLERTEKCLEGSARLAKLTRSQIPDIRRLHKEEGMTYTELGRLYGVAPATIRDVVLERTWKHVL